LASNLHFCWHFSWATLPAILPQPIETLRIVLLSCFLHLVYQKLLRRHWIISFTLWLIFLVRLKVLIPSVRAAFSLGIGTKCSQEWYCQVLENEV
jgi:hypothetical protein